MRLNHFTEVKIALGVRQSFNNNICYIEAGKHPLECKIKSLQHKFWTKIIDYVSENPDAAIAKVIHLAGSNNSYIKYYKNLVQQFSNYKFCEMSLEARFRGLWRDEITAELTKDHESRLGYYVRVNPELKPFVPRPQRMLECERILLTRFRTGSHSLSIELGRISGIKRENRLCKCRLGIQSVWHVFNDCPITLPIHHGRFSNVCDVFNDPNVTKLILQVTSILKIQI